MVFKKITSTLLLMTILLQPVLPAFAMEEDNLVLEKKEKKSFSPPICESSELIEPLQSEEGPLAETVIRKGFVLASLKSNLTEKDFVRNVQFLELLKFWAEKRESPEVSDTIKRMSGYLSDEATAELKTNLQKCPYTQTEAYLSWMASWMGGEEFKQGRDPQQQVETFLRRCSQLKTIQTPPLPSDQHYVNVLTQALENEKKHSDKAVFYHASDPLTSFLWDIFTAYRSHLQLRGRENRVVLRALDDKFSSFLDVEAFIKKYSDEIGKYSDYTTVEDIPYADLGFSINPFLLGNDGDGQSSTYFLFYKTSSVSPTHQQALFDYFMSTLGIPGEFKNYEAFFNQYYKVGPQSNAYLLQIFINPQILDSVSYMATLGGRILTLGEKDHPDHRFGSYLSEIRTNPVAFNESLKTQCGLSLLNIQGRLFLKPEVFHNPEFVKVETYRRYPMTSEAAYCNKLNDQITQDLTQWLLLHTCLPSGVFFDGQCSLIQMYRYVYEGQLRLPYRVKSFKSLLSGVLRSGNMPLIDQIFEAHPEIDLNEGVPSLDYRSGATPKIVSPFNLLSTHTSNFSDVVQFLIGKKVKMPPVFSINCEDKLLNEFVGSLDHLPEEFKTWTTGSLARKFNFSLGLSEYEESQLFTNIVECHLNGYKHTFSFIAGKCEKFLRAYFLEEAKKIMETEEERGTFTNLNVSPKMINAIEALLILRDTLNIPEFTSLWNHMLAAPNDYIRKFCASNKDTLVLSLLGATKAGMIDLGDTSRLTNSEENRSNFIEALASNTNLKILKISSFSPSFQFLKKLLTDPRFASLETVYASENYNGEMVDDMIEGLKGNATLKELIAPEAEMTSIMMCLMSLPQGPFTNAPWFIKTKSHVH